MYYSDAIRLGAMLDKKEQNHFFNHGGSCVQGAALKAIGAVVEPISVIDNLDSCRLFHKNFPAVSEQLMCNEDSLKIMEHISPYLSHGKIIMPELSIRLGSELLNDRTDLTREEIADWVEKMEWKYGIRKKEADQHERQEESTDTVESFAGVS